MGGFLMRTLLFSMLIASVLCVSLPIPSVQAQDPGKQPSMPDMQAAMEKAKKVTQPGPNHKVLERFLGRWQTESRMFMSGQTTPPEKGTAEGKWLIEGRWMTIESTGSMMGMPMQTFTLMGYDNFKQSFVMTYVNSIDTAMLRSEGDLDRTGKMLIAYGTLDEYLTGEHDKMVKYVWRFQSDDKFVLEVHDLHIGDENTKVIDVTYTRAGAGSE
jgi:hypothetical protein